MLSTSAGPVAWGWVCPLLGIAVPLETSSVEAARLAKFCFVCFTQGMAAGAVSRSQCLAQLCQCSQVHVVLGWFAVPLWSILHDDMPTSKYDT